VFEGNITKGIEVTRRRGRRCKQLLDDLKETGGCWKLKAKSLDRKLRRTPFVRGYGAVVIIVIQRSTIL